MSVFRSLAEGAVTVLPRQVHNPMSNFLQLSYPPLIFGFLSFFGHRHRFEEAAEQFRLDVAANPNDTEESIWCFLCEAQLYGVEEARKRFLEAILFSL